MGETDRGWEARYDAYVQTVENGPRPGRMNTTDPEIMRVEHEWLDERGLLEPGEPTPWTHHLHQQINADVAAMEPWERDALAAALTLHTARPEVSR
jgi:hypothetical protein